MKAIAETRPDVLFLDVQMPASTGSRSSSSSSATPTGRPAVVFVTAYDQYALKAFDANAVDYLLKPFDRARFDTALERPARGSSPARAPARRLAPSAQRARSRASSSRTATTVTVLPVATIDCVKAEDDYVLLRAGGRNHLKQQTLASLEARFRRSGSSGSTARTS